MLDIIAGNDFPKYNPELDWSGQLFKQYPEVYSLKQQTGIYAFTLCGKIVYIGSSRNLFGRLQTHIAHIQGKTNQNSTSIEKKKYYYLSKYLPYVQFKILYFYDEPVSKNQLEEKEYSFINKYCPIFNIDGCQLWNDSAQAVDDFVHGVISMDDLKMTFNKTK